MPPANKDAYYAFTIQWACLCQQSWGVKRHKRRKFLTDVQGTYIR